MRQRSLFMLLFKVIVINSILIGIAINDVLID